MRKTVCVAGLFFTTLTYVGSVGCHMANHTAGRPDSEEGEGQPGSVTASKEGTGDPKVGAGRGQVGTDAPPKAKAEHAKPVK